MVQVLVRHHSEDKVEGVVLLSCQLGSHKAQSGLVVARIADNRAGVGGGGNVLPPPGDAGFGQPASHLHGGKRTRQSLRQAVERGKSRTEIALLVVALHAQLERKAITIQKVFHLIEPPLVLRTAITLVGKEYRRVGFMSPGNKGRSRFGLILPDHHQHRRFDDAGLFGRNFRERIPQKLHVVETDVGDDADQRRDDIRTVQPSAHSDLHHGDIDPFVSEPVEGHHGSYFEKRGVERFNIGSHPFDELHDSRLGHRDAIHLNPLPKILQVGRGI